MTETIKSVTDLPFTERRYIAVLSDADYEKSLKDVRPFQYGDIILEAIPLVVPGGLGVRLIAKIGLKYAISKSNQEYSKNPKKYQSLIQALPLREANKFKFLSGTAEIGRTYAVNPLRDDIYYSVESYNDDMIDHKLSELERILNSLRAKSYKIIFEADESVDGAFRLSAKEKGFLKKGASVTAEAEYHRARARRFERGGTSQGGDPILASNLVWLSREPSWQALVESRLHYGRENFDLRVTLDRDLRISSKVATDLKVLRLDIDASLEKRSNITLSVVGSF
jgi:hypothetical protein